MSVYSGGQQQSPYSPFPLYLDPFVPVTSRRDFLEIENLIRFLNDHKKGTFFINNPYARDQENFLQIYEKIPDILKYRYLTIRDQSGNTIVHYLATCVKIEFVSKIFNYLSDGEKCRCMCFRNDKGETPLHWTVCNSNVITGFCILNSIENLYIRSECFSIITNEGCRPQNLTISNVSDIMAMLKCLAII